jgi:hypothetical protein
MTVMQMTRGNTTSFAPLVGKFSFCLQERARFPSARQAAIVVFLLSVQKL